MEPTKLFLAEGQDFVRDAMRLLLDNQPDFSVIGEANSSHTMLAAINGSNPDVILLDWFLPAFEPLQALNTIREHYPKTIIIATSVRPELAAHIYQFNVDGFLSKQLSPDEFVQQLKELSEKKEEI